MSFDIPISERYGYIFDRIFYYLIHKQKFAIIFCVPTTHLPFTTDNCGNGVVIFHYFVSVLFFLVNIFQYIQMIINTCLLFMVKDLTKVESRTQMNETGTY